MAARLAEAGHSVGVIEAGSFYEITNGKQSDIPAFATKGSTGLVTDILPLVDWGFITTPQAGLGGRLVHYAQGKTLGGGSARNVLAYQRGTRGAYDLWASTVQDQSFSFDNFLPYFKKSPTFTPPNTSKLPPGTNISYDPSAFSSSGGPLHVSYSNYQQPITSYIRTALQKVGLQSIAGFNSGNLIGFANAAYTIDPATETRSSSETAFLRDAIEHQAPFTVYVETMAKKILLDGSKKANGVVVNTAGFTYTLSATKEVIVAAGVFKTPQLLMVSGIGPSATLLKYGIPVVSALGGVGQNIVDHPYYGIGFKTNVTTDQQLGNPAVLDAANTAFVQSQTGPLTNVGVDLIGWEKIPSQYRTNFSTSATSDLAKYPSDWPEIEILPIAAATFPVTDTSNYASITIANVAPLSRGTVSINSSDTNDPPQINPNWLTSTTDQQVAVASVRVARDIAAASGLMVGPEAVPGPTVQTDAQILAYLQQTAYTIHHAVSSCKLAPSVAAQPFLTRLCRQNGAQVGHDQRRRHVRASLRRVSAPTRGCVDVPVPAARPLPIYRLYVHVILYQSHPDSH